MTVKQPVYTPSQGIRGSDPIINAAEDLRSLAQSPSVGNALQTASSAVDAAVSVAGSMSSPVQAVASTAVRLALEYLSPLKDWMNQLTGDSAQVNGIGVSWKSVSDSLSSVADELESNGQSAMAEMSGESVSAYLMRQGQVINVIRGVAGTSSKFGDAVATVATLVKKVHDLICAVVSKLIGIVADAAAKSWCSAGFSLIDAGAEIAEDAVKWAKDIGNILTMVENAFKAIEAMVDMIGTATSKLTSSIREVGKDCAEPGGGCCGEGASTGDKPGEKYVLKDGKVVYVDGDNNGTIVNGDVNVNEDNHTEINPNTEINIGNEHEEKHHHHEGHDGDGGDDSSHHGKASQEQSHKGSGGDSSHSGKASQEQSHKGSGGDSSHSGKASQEQPHKGSGEHHTSPRQQHGGNHDSGSGGNNHGRPKGGSSHGGSSHHTSRPRRSR